MYLSHKLCRVKPTYSWLNYNLRHVCVIKPMQKSRSWEVNGFSGSQNVLLIVSNTKVHYRVHKSLPLVSTLRQKDPVHALSCFGRCEGYSFLLHSQIASTGAGRLHHPETEYVSCPGDRQSIEIKYQYKPNYMQNSMGLLFTILNIWITLMFFFKISNSQLICMKYIV